jgi:hypothetical protein
MWRRKPKAGYRFGASHEVVVLSDDDDDDEVEVTYDAREDREREERAQREREEREQRAREQSSQREREERSQRERAQREREQQERAQREREQQAQRERAQRERAQREQRERAQRAREERAQRERAQRERDERAQREEEETDGSEYEDSDSDSDSGPRSEDAVKRGEGMSRPVDLEDVCEYYRRTRLSEAEIRSGRERIARQWTETRRADFEELSKEDLEHLFKLYDETFFAGAFGRKLRADGHELEMVPTKILSRTAGRCAFDPHKRRRRCVYTIEISTQILRDAFVRPATYPVGGLLCRSRLECMQLTLEHEMVHLLMYMWQKCNDPLGNRRTRRTVVDGLVVGGHGPTFRRLVLNMFGHTATRHGLFTSVEDGEGNVARPTGAVQLKHSGLKVGESVVVRGKAYKVLKLNPTRFIAVDAMGTTYRIGYGLVGK